MSGKGPVGKCFQDAAYTTDWHRGVVYEMNVRQYTSEGTFKAAQQQLARLKDLGIDIIWLMPIHPIGEQGRKGTLGSYYAPRNYKEVNPEFGTMADFDAFLAEAHRLGMHVILDWVANHTSPDAVWKPMFERFRKDFPGTYYLAEGERPDLHEAFDASYAWELHHLLNDVAQGKAPAKAVTDYMVKDDSIAKSVPANYWRLTFTSNHDENSWSGTEMERMGQYHRLMALLTFTLPHSQPLIYTGQEIGFDHRLQFFEKDPIPSWDANDYTEDYQMLCELRHAHPALLPEAAFECIDVANDSCLAFRRLAENDTVTVFVNLSHSPVSFDGDVIPAAQGMIGL